jgi:hypothetical protein
MSLWMRRPFGTSLRGTKVHGRRRVLLAVAVEVVALAVLAGRHALDPAQDLVVLVAGDLDLVLALDLLLQSLQARCRLLGVAVENGEDLRDARVDGRFLLRRWRRLAVGRVGHLEDGRA